MIVCFRVLIAFEIAVTLVQTEPARGCFREIAAGQARGVVQGPPDRFTIGAQNIQTVAVMHLGAKVVELCVVLLGVEIH